MKIASKEEVNAYTNAIVMGFVKGAAVGTVASFLLYRGLRQYSSFYRSLTPTTKTFFALSPPIGFGMTNAEWASLKFDQEQYKFGEALEAKKEIKQEVEKLSTMEKIKLYSVENKYKIISGLWAASLGGSFWIINRDKYMTKAQKIVQARMYAQALTVALLLGSMFLSVSDISVQKVVKDEQDEYSWENIVKEEEKREKAAGIPLRLTDKTQSHSEKA